MSHGDLNIFEPFIPKYGATGIVCRFSVVTASKLQILQGSQNRIPWGASDFWRVSWFVVSTLEVGKVVNPSGMIWALCAVRMASFSDLWYLDVLVHILGRPSDKYYCSISIHLTSPQTIQHKNGCETNLSPRAQNRIGSCQDWQQWFWSWKASMTTKKTGSALND